MGSHAPQAHAYAPKACTHSPTHACAALCECVRVYSDSTHLDDARAGLDFKYTDPERGFDRGSVKGVLARLVAVKDPAAATALEVAAGGKLFQVVVDTDATAKALLAKGQLRARVTIIPLNKVCSRIMHIGAQPFLWLARRTVGAGRPIAVLSSFCFLKG